MAVQKSTQTRVVEMITNTTDIPTSHNVIHTYSAVHVCMMCVDDGMCVLAVLS